MNCTCDGMNFTHLTYLMLQHYLVIVKNTENVILPREFTKENCIRCITLHKSGPGSSCALNLLILGVIQQCVYETIQDIDNLRKRLMQTSIDFD